MLLTTKGIILRQVKYGETSLICDIYTLEKGRITVIVNGVRSPKAKIKPALLQPCALVEIQVYFKEQKTIHRLKEIRLFYVYESLLFDVLKGSMGLFLIEVSSKTIKESEKNSALFHFLAEIFQLLDQTDRSIANYHLAFLCRYASFLGLQPEPFFGTELVYYFDYQEGRFMKIEPTHRNYFTAEESNMFNFLLKADFLEGQNVKMNRNLRRSLLKGILSFFQFHLNHMTEIQSHQVLEDILS